MRSHGQAGTRPLDAIDDDQFTRFHPVLDDPQVVEEPPQFHRAVLDDILLVHGEEVFLSLIRPDGTLGNQRGLILIADRNTNPGKQSRSEGVIGIGEHSAHLDRPGLGINLVVGKVDHPFIGEARFAGQPKMYRDFRFPDVWYLLTSTRPFSRRLLILQQCAFINVEVDVDRVQ